jgi:hypothetical protein
MGLLFGRGGAPRAGVRHMRRPGKWHACRLARLIRGLRFDRNPLRRGFDRAETAIIAGLLAAFFVSAPFIAVTAGHWIHTASLREQRVQTVAWHQVSARLLKDAPADSFASYGPADTSALARWTAPNGSRHTGFISVAAGTRAGTTVSTWMDASGKPTGPPLQAAQVADRAALAVMLAPLVPAILLLAAWKLARRELERRRSAAWDADWRATGPQWTSRRLARPAGRALRTRAENRRAAGSPAGGAGLQPAGLPEAGLPRVSVPVKREHRI